MPQLVWNPTGEIPEDVYNKWEDFTKLISGIRAKFREYPELERELEELAAGRKVRISSKDLNDQASGTFTRRYVIEPILRFLGYSPRNDAVMKGTAGCKQPDYRIKDVWRTILVEAEPLGSDLHRKGYGISQVVEWLDSRSFSVDVGIATNGFRWVLLYYDDTMKGIKVLADVDLTDVFLGGDEGDVKRKFAEFYLAFSKEHIEDYIVRKVKAIEEKRKAITREFYREFIYHVFGYREVKRRNRVELVEATKKSIYHGIKAPLGATEEDKKRFAVLLMNKLMFVKFLEGRGLVPRKLLKETFREWESSSVSASYYKSYLEPLFYGVLNTQVEEKQRLKEYFESIPYLNGGLFRENLRNEREYDVWDNDAIRRVIDFLEGYDFTLKEEGTKTKPLNPDVLGHVYEKLINLLTGEGQKGLGTYYTPDDITTFMARAVIEPVLVEKLKAVLKRRGWKEQDVNFNTLDEALNPEDPITRNGKLLREFLEEINRVRILDPAVGSGHFLISALKELLQVKKRVYAIIGENPDPYQLKLEIILNNLYGVDIDETAVEVAKLRLWLSLIEDLDVEAVKRGDVVLPDIGYNLRVGNSLVGWTREKLVSATRDCPHDLEIEGIFMGLRAALRGNEAVKIKRAEELLRKPNGSIKDYLEAYRILYEIYRNSVGKKASELKTILEDIRERIYQRVDGEYLGYLNTNREVHPKVRGKVRDVREFRRKFKPFHWSVDFWWIMEDGGFDIVIGNPPYGGNVSEFEKYLSDPEGIMSKRNIAKAFILRAFKLVRDGGYVSFIVPKSLTYASDWSGVREFLLKPLVGLYDVKEAFEDVLLEQVIFIAQKGETFEEYTTKDLFKSTSDILIKKKELPVDTWICDITPEELRIVREISRKSTSNFGELVKTYRGLPIQRYFLKEGDGVEVIGGKNIGAYEIKGNAGFIVPERLPEKHRKTLEKYQKPKVVFQNIVAFVSNPVPHLKVMGAYDESGRVPLDTVNVIENRGGLPWQFTLGFMNSLFFSWLLHVFAFNRAVRTMHLDNYAISKVPVPGVDEGVVERVSKAVEEMLEEGFNPDTYFRIEDEVLGWYGFGSDNVPDSYAKLREHYRNLWRD